MEHHANDDRDLILRRIARLERRNKILQIACLALAVAVMGPYMGRPVVNLGPQVDAKLRSLEVESITVISPGGPDRIELRSRAEEDPLVVPTIRMFDFLGRERVFVGVVEGGSIVRMSSTARSGIEMVVEPPWDEKASSSTFRIHDGNGKTCVFIGYHGDHSSPGLAEVYVEDPARRLSAGMGVARQGTAALSVGRWQDDKFVSRKLEMK